LCAVSKKSGGISVEKLSKANRMEGLDTLGRGAGAQKVMKDVGDKKDRFSPGIITSDRSR
jgi:hypothetical protein